MDAPPTLSYATPNSDGLPLCDPAAEALIDGGAPPGALKPLMGSGRQAARYYGKSFARRYAAAASQDVCAFCGATPAGRFAKTLWRVGRPMRALRLGNDIVASVDAYHPVCPTCVAAWRERISRWWWLRRSTKIVQYGGLLTVAALVPTLIFREPWMWWVVGGSVAAQWLAVIIYKLINSFAVRHVTPPQLLAMRRRDFFFIGVMAFGDRQAALRAESLEVLN